MTSHTIDLSDLDGLLANAKPAERKAYDPVPNGRYQAFVDRAHVDQHEETGTRQLVWELVILAGPQRGRRLWHKNVLITQKNLDWLLADLDLAGVPAPTSMNALHASAPALLDLTFEVRVTNETVDGKAYTKTFLNKRLALEIPADLRNTSGGSGDDFHSTF
jgi:hypothetical protein